MRNVSYRRDTRLVIIVVLLPLGIILFILICCLHYGFRIATVENMSMFPTLEPGHRVLVIKYWPSRWLRKGQIILLTPSRGWIARDGRPANTALVESHLYIKRIVALAGETFIAPIGQQKEGGIPENTQACWYIPQGYIFVCGDNPQKSHDSRIWGPIPVSWVYGLVILKLPLKVPTQSQE
jgi:signal peptidase I